MKKVSSLVLAAVLLCTLFTGCGDKNTETVGVESVAMITGYGAMGTINRFAGMVVSGQTAEIKKDSDKTVKEILVESGDMVQEGDVLFTYDSDALELSLTKLELEIEGYKTTIDTAARELPQLEELRNNTWGDQQLGYSLQIQTLQANVREAEYNKALKERELELMREAVDNVEVRSPLTGRVTSVNEGTGDGGDGGKYPENGSGSSDAFITVMDVTSFRVEGKINEMNAGSFVEGMNVLVRSRVDESATWTGVLEKIDWEKGSTGNSNEYYYSGSSDATTTTTSYPFYVALDSSEALLLGQHVYVEPDYGQNETAAGLWLPGTYISDADSSPYVWAQNSRNKIEKRNITLGEYDAETDRYEVLSGLTAEDYIAFPLPGIRAGMPTAPYDEATFMGEFADEGMGEFMGEDFPPEEFMEEGLLPEDEMMEDIVLDGTAMDDIMVDSETAPEDGELPDGDTSAEAAEGEKTGETDSGTGTEAEG